VKGSPPEVLALCRWQWRDGAFHPLDDEDRAHIEGENERMAADALRVLGVASCEDVELKGDDPENGCVWLGLVGMADPVRHGVKALINRFQRAGINTVMITGDQGPTAYAVGKELDLSCGRQLEILEATHLTRMDQEVLAALAAKVHIFARVSPAHKLQIVRALQSGGRVVAMAGDGINDGPALKAADIGIAMGNGGTEIAREVADVVLEEDNLESMIIAVRDGRTIYRNIRKSLHFLLSTNFSEIMVMLVAVAAGLGAPLNAMQLLWINLISDIFPGLALALEPPEPDVLEQPSRPPDEPIVKSADFRRLAFESSMLSAGAMGAYGYGLLRLGADAHAGTLAFQSLTLGQLLHAWSCRSEDHSIFSSPHLPPNRPLSLALGTSFALQGLTILLPRLRALLGLAPIGLADGAVIMGSALLPFVINEATKNTSQGDSQ
jgi:Ca2+-transporting ATPase